MERRKIFEIFVEIEDVSTLSVRTSMTKVESKAANFRCRSSKKAHHSGERSPGRVRAKYRVSWIFLGFVR